MEVLDNDFFQGRLLHVMPAMPRKTSDKQVSVVLPFLSFCLHTCNILLESFHSFFTNYHGFSLQG